MINRWTKQSVIDFYWLVHTIDIDQIRFTDLYRLTTVGDNNNNNNNNNNIVIIIIINKSVFIEDTV